MSWFEEWFDSPLYEKLYAYRNEAEAAQLADLIEKIIPKKIYPRILDLGCGRGRHSITLAERGYRVTGIDLSEEAIKKARKQSDEKQLENTEFLVRDMRLPLKATFDAVLNLFTTFGYFLDDDENRKVLQSTRQMLQTDGIFLIDFLNAEQVKKEIIPEDKGSFKEIEFQIKRYIKNGMVYKEINFRGPSLSEPVQYQERVKLYDLDWFEENLNASGFSLRKVYGSYTGQPFSIDESSRLIMVCRKEK
jgi:SAM-dependent methyltransferase